MEFLEYGEARKIYFNEMLIPLENLIRLMTFETADTLLVVTIYLTNVQTSEENIMIVNTIENISAG